MWSKSYPVTVCYNIIILSAVPLSAISDIAMHGMASTASTVNEKSTLNTTVSVTVLWAALCIQYIGILVSTFKNAVRMQSMFVAQEVEHHKNAFSANVCTTVVAILPSILLVPFALPQAPRYAWAIAIIMFVCECLNIGGNMHFLCVDARMALSKLLKNAATSKNTDVDLPITVESVENVRKEVHAIVSRGLVPNNALMITALSNVGAAFALFIIADDVNVLCMIVCFLFKEVIVAVVGLVHVALVNEAYHSVIGALGDRMFQHCCSEKGSQSAEHKLQLCLTFQNLQAKPITFPLSGMVLTRREVAFRFGMWLFGVILSTAKKLL